MTFWIIYLLKVILIQGGLYVCYWLFFRQTRRHQFNRLFLLIGLFTSFAIPLVELPQAEKISIVPQSERVITWLSEPAFDYEVVLLPIEQTQDNASLWVIIPALYIVIAFLFLTRSLKGLFSLHKFKRHSEMVKKYWFNLFKTSHARPFSFFSNVFIPKSLFGTEDFDQVLAHECVHVKQHHSVDRLLLDFVVSLFWFNPFIYLYRNALIEIHEYQADEEVVNRFKDPIHYQEILFSQLQAPQYSGMVSHFNVEIIKKRIVMMNKKNKQSRWIYLLAAPLTLVMIFAFSSKEAMNPIENVGNEIANMMGPVKDFSLPAINNWDQQDFTPSISPVKDADLVRLTSGFGMRMHPIYKVKKIHLGVDFSCRTGSEIIATADGIVEEIKTTFDGYGMRITIKHGELYKTKYAQLSAFKVSKGDIVKKGDVIALSGNSGASTAPHLHYEIIDLKTGGRVDPKPFIKNYEFKVMLKEIPSKEDNDGDSKDAREENEEHKLVELENRRIKSDTKQEDNLEQKNSEQNLINEEKFKEEVSFKDEKQENGTLMERIFIHNENKKPLIVLDGKKMKESSLDDIDPSTLSEVVVYKDKKAIDKYGDAGKNGVIEITTKDKRKRKNKNKQKEKEKQKAFRVIIDPGHGGKDAGESYANNVYEKDFVLSLARKIEEEFKDQQEIEILLTRASDSDLSLKERKSKATNADLFISLHSQDYGDVFGGSVVLMYSNANYYFDRSKQIATVLHDKFNDLNEGTCSLASFSSDGEGSNEYWLLNNLEVPAVMVQLNLEKNEGPNVNKSAIASRIATGIRIAAF